MRACGWQLIGVRLGQSRFEKVSFGRKSGLKRTLAEPRKPHFPLASLIFSPASLIFPLASLIFRSQASFFSPASPIFRSQALFPARHTPLFRLISLHERRSRNMMARVVRRELSALSNFIPAVKRSPKTSFQQPFVPQTPPPGRTGGRRGGASMVSLPRKRFQCMFRRVRTRTQCTSQKASFRRMLTSARVIPSPSRMTGVGDVQHFGATLLKIIMPSA